MQAGRGARDAPKAQLALCATLEQSLRVHLIRCSLCSRGLIARKGSIVELRAAWPRATQQKHATLAEQSRYVP